ncbi:MAG: riboflavin synthase [Balneolales bacterium]
MFNGIIKNLGTVKSIEDQGGRKLLQVTCDFVSDLTVDESISINGVCQTVIGLDENNASFAVQVIEETLSKTALGELKQGEMINLERSLRLSERISGHIVQGHVDTVGIINSINREEGSWLFTISYPKEFSNHIVGRGSISIDGISLTIAREKQNEFTIGIIPYTFENTNLKFKKTNDPVNLEFDIFGKYTIKYLESLKGLD